jgi:8-hydroxy-5-deazaflavin:NADPH oxidoreductase
VAIHQDPAKTDHLLCRKNYGWQRQSGETTMRITVFGKGNVGGGLADQWAPAGHQVTRLGRDGGDVSDADVVLVAVPGELVVEAFGRLTGVEGKTVIDATNRIGIGPPEGFASNAEVEQL